MSKLTTAAGAPIADNQNSMTAGERDLPQNYRQINGYGSHTFSFVNAANERFWVKWTNEEALEVIGRDRESAQKDLFANIEKGNFPKWRLFSYGDAQRYRLGVNHHQILVNAPRCPFHHSFHRDGAMRTDGNQGGTLNYEPNRAGEFAQDRNAAEPPLAIQGAADRYDHRVDNDYYSQAGALFRLMNASQQQQLFGNIAVSIAGVPEEIKRRQLDHFHRADPAYAAGVAKALDFPHEAPNAIP
jgi:catalase